VVKSAEQEPGLIGCLRTSDLFAGLDDEMLAKIAMLCQEQSCKAGAVIFSEGDPAGKLYILNEGIVTIRIQPAPDGKSFVVQPIEKKAGVFGWSGLADPSIYTASAVCATDVKVIAIDGEKLMALLEEFPAAGLVVMRRLVTIIGSRLRRTREYLKEDVHLASYHFQ
jgi:CRP/FNR family cyclic AMP-dependent transcriptional regulator